MARSLILVAADAAAGVTAFETLINARLASKLSHLIGWVQITSTDKLPSYSRELRVSIDLDDTGAAITHPYKVKVIEAESDADAVARAQTFMAANPAFFFAPLQLVYTDQLPNIRFRYLYFLFYNEDSADGTANWDYAYLSAGSSGSTYLNPAPTTAQVGGIAVGSTFPVAKTMQEMWDLALHPFIVPTFSAFAITGESTSQEVGDSIPAAVTFTWTTTTPGNVAPNSIDILDITGGLTLATNLADDGSEAVLMPAPVSLVAPGSYVFRITGEDTQATLFQRNLTFTWFFRRFVGNNVAATLTEAQIEALSLSALASGYAGTYATGAGGFKYICFANSVGGQINTVKDSDTLLNVPFATVADDPAYSNVDGGGFSFALVSVTNPFGVTDNYRVYRTQNSLGAAITLIVT